MRSLKRLTWKDLQNLLLNTKKASCRLIQSRIQQTFIDGLSARHCFNTEDKLFSDTDKSPCPMKFKWIDCISQNLQTVYLISSIHIFIAKHKEKIHTETTKLFMAVSSGGGEVKGESNFLVYSLPCCLNSFYGNAFVHLIIFLWNAFQ